jgi:hypothetical protein
MQVVKESYTRPYHRSVSIDGDFGSNNIYIISQNTLQERPWALEVGSAAVGMYGDHLRDFWFGGKPHCPAATPLQHCEAGP